jgi:hypothetical protein
VLPVGVAATRISISRPPLLPSWDLRGLLGPKSTI